jgi:hypothetical protein
MSKVTLEDLIGDVSRLTCIESSFEIRGLTVKAWTFQNPAVAALPPVIGR